MSNIAYGSGQWTQNYDSGYSNYAIGPHFHTHTSSVNIANTTNTTARLYKYFRCRSFTQHWIMVGKRLRVLLLDFDAKFTLLIPNIEPGKAFRINKADVEVQTKELEGGVKLTFMKFLFQSPQLEIKAPVLNDKEVGYRVLSQNGACVFLKRILNLPPPGQVGPGAGPPVHPGGPPGNPQSMHGR